MRPGVSSQGGLHNLLCWGHGRWNGFRFLRRPVRTEESPHGLPLLHGRPRNRPFFLPKLGHICRTPFFPRNVHAGKALFGIQFYSNFAGNRSMLCDADGDGSTGVPFRRRRFGGHFLRIGHYSNRGNFVVNP